MKRYYTPDGEPDEAKTLWEGAKRIILGITAFCMVCIVVNECNHPPKPDRTSPWKNLDDSRDLSEVRSYDYANGIIHYRDDEDEGIYISLPDSVGEAVLTIKAMGKTIELTQTEAEELLDQLTEDADYYEYFERNMD